MKTASVRHLPPGQSSAAAPVNSLSMEQRFTVVTGSKELDLSFFGAMYAVLELLRSGIGCSVYFQQGDKLFEHSGAALVSGRPDFLQAVSDFESYLLAERNAGFVAGAAASAAPAQAPNALEAPPHENASAAEKGQGSRLAADDNVRDGGRRRR